METDEDFSLREIERKRNSSSHENEKKDEKLKVVKKASFFIVSLQKQTWKVHKDCPIDCPMDCQSNLDENQ